jgi:hypothetical protein
VDDDGWLVVGAMHVLGLDMQVPLASFDSLVRYYSLGVQFLPGLVV